MENRIREVYLTSQSFRYLISSFYELYEVKKMKKRLTILVLLFVISRVCITQSSDSLKDSKPALTNVPGVEFPRIDSQLRAIFRVEAPDVQKFQLDLGKVYDMVKGDDRIWTVTTEPLPPGFHYFPELFRLQRVQQT